MSQNEIVVKGARENNLKGIDVSIPREKMVVITGLSGSGKSSLAFNTIYAEGQRRYVESLSSYARQFLGQMDKPNVEYIEGLSPSISIDQKTTSNNPRSTVGTVTEIYDYLRLLFARLGRAFCPVCGKEVASQSVDQMVDDILKNPQGTRLKVLAPVVRGKKGGHVRLIANIKSQGFNRIIVDGEEFDLFEDIDLDKAKKHDIDIVVDRIIIKEGIESRLTDSIETALDLSKGILRVDLGGHTVSYSENMACPDGHIQLEEIEPRSFSFNSPFGMCKTCDGLGFHLEVDSESLIPDGNLSLNEGAIAPYNTAKKGTYYYEYLAGIAKHHGFPMDEPIKNAPEEMIRDILEGTSYKVEFKFKSAFSGNKLISSPWEGAIANVRRRYFSSDSNQKKERLGQYMVEKTCPSCHGSRLSDEVLSVRVNDKNIAQVTSMAVVDAIKWFDDLELTRVEAEIGEEILKEIKARLRFLNEVGLSYLTLARRAGTLSGGEAQRIRLATQIGSGLVGVIYVMDEPSIGLHPRDNEKLLGSLRSLTNLGNSLIIVEHDDATMKEADQIIDIGPGAGIHGGELVFQGSYDEILKDEKSITGQYLSGRKKIEVPQTRRQAEDFIEIKGARENNLKDIDVKIPLRVLTCVTGVSGSGKSSLINNILERKLSRDLNKAKIRPGEHDQILGIENLDKVIRIDQSPIGRTPRSNPATYTKVFDPIRTLFSETPDAKMKGYDKGRFSFNIKGGRCENCSGDGTIKVEMHFLSDVYVPCEVCGGTRYNRETLQVKYRDKNISDVLNMTIEEGLEFFQNHTPIKNKLQTLYDVGLGYLKLGQSSTELSGGEAQRVKLATELSKTSTGRTIYILDEPTTGLHAADIHRLVDVLNRLTEDGNTVIVIEHNLDVIKTADYIIDLGPEGGDQGGNLVASGTPEEVAKVKKSHTGRFLKDILKEG